MAKFNFKRAVLAIGGNAVERDGDIFSSAAIEDAASFIRPLSEGRKLAIVHGNGPQFGFLSERYERMELYDKTAADVIKDSQDAIGSLLQWKLLEVDSSSMRPIAIDNTYVVVDPTDPSFENPVKGVGTWRYGSDFFEANNMSYTSHPDIEMCGYFREIVSSPKPLEVIDIDKIREGVDSGLIIICGGGGGIPVFKNQSFDFDFQRKNCSRYNYYTIAKDRMVIDKDATAALIADGINADILIILTDVPGFIDGYGTSNARIVREMSSNEAFERIYDNGEGSMNPKLAAAASFVGANLKRRAIITSLVESARLAKGDLSEATLIKPSKEVAA